MAVIGIGQKKCSFTLCATDVAAYLRLGRCERFLSIRVRERSGENVFAEYGVAPHPVAPLLRAVGEDFEAEVFEHIARTGLLVRCGDASEDGRPRGADNARIVDTALRLDLGACIIFAQPAVAARIGRTGEAIELFGNIDLLQLSKLDDGTLHVLAVDVKRSAEARLDHYFQVALYAAIVGEVLAIGGVSVKGCVGGGVLRARNKPGEADGGATFHFGCGDVAVLEVVPDPEVYRWAADDFIFSEGAVARRAASCPIPDALAVLGIRCDGCINQEVCHLIAEAQDDLSLIPGLTVREKRILMTEGVRTLTELVTVTGQEKGSRAQRLIAKLGVGYSALVRKARATVRSRKKQCGARPGTVVDIVQRCS